MTPDADSHAVVIGASIAGLTMAQALTDGFDQVTVLERDRLPDRPVPRNGVPQGRHVHLLLEAGAQALEELFPDIIEELVTSGANLTGINRARLCFNGHHLARPSAGEQVVGASRPLLEGHLRDRVRGQPGVTLRDQTQVTGLVHTTDGQRVTGVRARSRSRTRGADDEEALGAALVVDCTGRRSRTPEWLADLGHRPPAVEELPVDVRYATRHYRLPDGALDGDRLLAIGPTSEVPRGGVALAIEDDRWVVTLYGLCGQAPPLDARGFEEFAATLPVPDMAAALEVADAIDEPAPYRYPASRRHHYEDLEDLPAGLLAAGDAVCTFNPIYGQGMTVAALQAVALRRLLAGEGPLTPVRWYATIAAIADGAWDIATGADLAVRCVQGRRSRLDRLRSAYVLRLHEAARHDPELTARFFRVTGLVDPPTRLLRPSTVARVLRGRLAGRRTRPDRHAMR